MDTVGDSLFLLASLLSACLLAIAIFEILAYWIKE